MRVATLLFYAGVTFLLGTLVTIELAQLATVSFLTGGPASDAGLAVASWVTYGGAGLFLLLAVLEIGWTIQQNGRR